MSLIDDVKKHEGFRSKVYKCTEGYDTIGYGFAIKDLELDFVDVVTTMETHLNICKILSNYKISTSIQKPFSDKLVDAQKIVNLYKKNKTILIATHNRELASKADYTLRLSDGNIKRTNV